ncbi:type I methionyl aminopeptidase [Niallia circulans]|jgi:methionyl aminopeptidase|uniref:Methionine aminopeptidase n=1 Tax=Niallia circulans TaxID=1397 RepID=A0A268FBS7_NIACI|nr:type I methionyl aminopeptidase [Niallia circulans]AYV69369.1 type I methionyl aminopeptidase [Niallia circulans]AYV72238.1 type I methionyl aminopeptidase [Niallia circulans]PAD82821.1 type I methionyl aminopeptidase [Niallia circulans]
MIVLKSKREIEQMKKAGEILVGCHKMIAKMIKPGITTLEIDQKVEAYLAEMGATPEQKGYRDYPYATCASINDEICHGFPRNEPLKKGDIVTIDMVVNYNGALADSAWTYAVGEVSAELQKLMDVTKKALYIGIEQAKVGNRIGDIGFAIQQYVEEHGFSVVRDFIGHGIGKVIHEKPEVPHFGLAGKGPRIKEGMVFTIEPMVNMGDYKMKMDNNGWTARTIDGKHSAQYEHTIAITKEGPVILTDQDA